jgi:hypothetical protein
VAPHRSNPFPHTKETFADLFLPANKLVNSL